MHTHVPAVPAVLALVAGAASAADVFLTPNDNLAEAVDSAEPGDVLILAPGVYSTDTISPHGTLTIRSSEGPSATVVMLAPEQAPGTLFSASSDGELTLEGLTFRGNETPFGSGDRLVEIGRIMTVNLIDMTFEDAERGIDFGTAVVGTVRDSRFLRIDKGNNSGAISIGNACDIEIVNTSFSSNGDVNAGQGGGAISTRASRLVVQGSSFSGNESAQSGGAISASNGVILSISGSTFSDNQTQGFGGAVHVQDGAARILNSEFIGNDASTGGDLYLESNTFSGRDAALAVQGCFFRDGDAQQASAVYISTQRAVFSNNVVVERRETSVTPVELDPRSGSPADGAVLTHNTFVGPGFFGIEASALAVEGRFRVVANNILRGFAHGQLNADLDGVIFDFNNIEGFDGSDTADTNNIDADPLFVNPERFDFQLSADSPSINAGSDELVGPDALDRNGNLNTREPLPVDALDRPRIAAAIGEPFQPDQGAFEFSPDGPPSPCPADLVAPFGVADLSDVDAFIASFVAGCP
ncbi:MAG: right-handed parallel beta-helix repeat-containing protein [Planctomycetota bacterium]